VDFDFALESLHHVDVDNVTKISELCSATIFRIDNYIIVILINIQLQPAFMALICFTATLGIWCQGSWPGMSN
jgi:hypothetical protein